MKHASFKERFRFSYTYALLQELASSLKDRIRPHRKVQHQTIAPAR